VSAPSARPTRQWLLNRIAYARRMRQHAIDYGARNTYLKESRSWDGEIMRLQLQLAALDGAHPTP
jgi:hypothetical protein